MFATMLDALRYRAQDAPDKQAVYDLDGERTYTFRQMEDRAHRMAAFLVERLRLHRGDRVAVVSGNSIYAIDLFFASCETGIIVDVLNPRLYQQELVRMLEAEAPAAVFFSGRYAEKALAVVRALDAPVTTLCYEGCPACELSGADIDGYRSVGTFVPVRPDWEDTQMLLHTGGTTGFPKAAMLSYRYFVMNALTEVISWRLTGEDYLYAAMPLFHTSGWNTSMLPAFMAGARISIAHDFSPETFIELVRKRRLTVFMGADLLLANVARHPQFMETDFSCVRLLCCGASTVSKATLGRFWAHGVRLIMGYGMTEYGPNVVSVSVDETLERNRQKPWIVGKPTVFNSARIVRADGTDAQVGEIGEIYLAGPLAFSGYWKNPEATAEAFDGKWVKTGDMGLIDADGDITICGRRKNMYISGGENVFPDEVEHCMQAHPGIADVCVIGVPDDKWGEVGKAVIVRSPHHAETRDELADWLRSRLSTIKRPRYYAFADSLPVNAAGKCDMPVIRRMYGNAADGRVAQEPNAGRIPAPQRDRIIA